MVELGLAFLVYFSPLFALALLVAALGGRGMSTRRTGSVAPGALDVHDASSRPVLASDAERDEACTTISHAVGEGRMTLDDAERRIERALTSRHRHELAALVRDLPRVPAALPARRPRSDGVMALVGATVLAAVLVQAVAGLWELWPVALAACGLWAVRTRH